MMLDTLAIERFDSCVKRATPSCPFLVKMKAAKRFTKKDETVKLNDMMEDAQYCKECPVYEKRAV